MAFSADQLLKSLQVVINNLLASSHPHDDNEVFSRELCFLIERFMNDGLRRGFFGGPPPFWQFVENLTQCLPGAGGLLNTIRNAAKTPVSRGRVFLRLSLNDGSLVEYLNALIWNKELVNQYYEPSAFLRQEENISAAMLQLDSVCRLKFAFAWKGRNYDDPFYGEEVLTAKVEALLKSSQQQTTNPSANQNVNSNPTNPSNTSGSGSQPISPNASSASNVSDNGTSSSVKPIDAVAYNDQLLNDLKKSIQQLVMESGSERAVYDHFDSLKSFLSTLDRMLSNALKGSLFGNSTWWEYVRNVSDKVPGADAVINRINSSETLDTPQLKMTAFLRLSLNENSLAHFLNALTWDVPLTDKYYNKESILKNDEQMAILVDLLESVSGLRFCLKVDEEHSSVAVPKRVATASNTATASNNTLLHGDAKANKKKGAAKRLVALDHNSNPLSPPSPSLVAHQAANEIATLATALDTVVAVIPSVSNVLVLANTESAAQKRESVVVAPPLTTVTVTPASPIAAPPPPLASERLTSPRADPSSASSEISSANLLSPVTPTTANTNSNLGPAPSSGSSITRSSHDLHAALDFLTTIDTNIITTPTALSPPLPEEETADNLKSPEQEIAFVASPRGAKSHDQTPDRLGANGPNGNSTVAEPRTPPRKQSFSSLSQLKINPDISRILSTPSPSSSKGTNATNGNNTVSEASPVPVDDSDFVIRRRTASPPPPVPYQTSASSASSASALTDSGRIIRPAQSQTTPQHAYATNLSSPITPASTEVTPSRRSRPLATSRDTTPLFDPSPTNRKLLLDDIIGSYHPMYGSHLARRMSIVTNADFIQLSPLDPVSDNSNAKEISPTDQQKSSTIAKKETTTVQKRENSAKPLPYVKRTFEDKPPMHSAQQTYPPNGFIQAIFENPATNKELRDSPAGLPSSTCRGCQVSLPRNPSTLDRSTSFLPLFGGSGAGDSGDGARFCYYTGGWYCKECHQNDQSVIPGRVLQKWDFKKYRVCIAANAHIMELYNKPLLNIGIANQSLYEKEVFVQIQELRAKLLQAGEYVFTCKNREALLLHVRGRTHLLESLHLFSLRDLEEVNAGTFVSFLQTAFNAIVSHITSCEGCRGKGFICDRCNDPEVIFAFQPETVRCLQCKLLYHKSCFTAEYACRKCMLLRRKAAANSNANGSLSKPFG